MFMILVLLEYSEPRSTDSFVCPHDKVIYFLYK